MKRATEETALVRQDAVIVSLRRASVALAEARTIQDTKQILDVAAAAEIYAKRQHLSRETFDMAHAIKIEAMAQIGRKLEDMPKNEGRAGPGRGKPPTVLEGGFPEGLPTIADLGLTYKESAEAQQLAALPPELFDAVKTGKTTTSKAVWKVKQAVLAAQKAAAPPRLPDGRYETIVIDPPWTMQKIAREVRPNQVAFDYPTMSEDELRAFDVPSIAAAACHLFCWTTHKHLPAALRLLDVWGFHYVCMLVWHKPGGFQPVGLPQYNCEFCVYARQGAPKFIDTKAFNCCFSAMRREHGRKPDEFYNVIRRVTAGPRIDVFSRETRDGFDVYGDEAGKFDKEAV